jgi:AcrR family transcriptional regulator
VVGAISSRTMVWRYGESAYLSLNPRVARSTDSGWGALTGPSVRCTGMAPEFTGGGDPARSVALLWRDREQRPTRGRKPTLGVDAIVAAAIETADEAGLGALSMRALAERLKVGTMSLYTHVPGKAELTDLMLDTVLGETAPPDDPPGGWRARVELVARQNLALFHRHPWLAEIVAFRPPIGPGVMAKYDHELRALEGIGLTDVEMDSVLTLVLGYVQSAARQALEATLVEQRTGLTDDEWWAAQAPLLERVIEPDRFPVASRVGTAASEAYRGLWDPDHTFEFGLERVLDGIEALVEARRAGGSRSRTAGS